MTSKILNIFKGEKKDGEDLKDKILVVKKSRCPQNHNCPAVKVCPVGALSQSGFAAPKVNAEECIKCGKCIKYCPMKALKFEA